MEEDAYEIRKKINELKERLRKIEGSSLKGEERAKMESSTVCGHDKVLDNLQTLCKERGHDGLAVMACWEILDDEDNRWYTTNVDPTKLSYFLRDVGNIVDHLDPILNKVSLKLLQLLTSEKREMGEEIFDEIKAPTEEIDENLSELEEKGLIEKSEQNWNVTTKGWQTFVVLGHLTFVSDIKLEPEKAVPISRAFHDVFDIAWGERIETSFEEVLERLEEEGWMKELREEGIEEEDIEKAVYESKYPR